MSMGTRGLFTGRGRDRKLSISGSRVLGLSPKNLLFKIFSWQGPILSSLLPRALQPHGAFSVACSFLAHLGWKVETRAQMLCSIGCPPPNHTELSRVICEERSGSWFLGLTPTHSGCWEALVAGCAPLHPLLGQ